MKRLLACLTALFLSLAIMGCSVGGGQTVEQKKDELAPLFGGVKGRILDDWVQTVINDYVLTWDVSGGDSRAAVTCYLWASYPENGKEEQLALGKANLYWAAREIVNADRVLSNTVSYKEVEVSGLPAIQLEADVKETGSAAHDTLVFVATTKGLIIVQGEVADDSKDEYAPTVKSFLETISIDPAEAKAYKDALAEAQKSFSATELEDAVNAKKRLLDSLINIDTNGEQRQVKATVGEKAEETNDATSEEEAGANVTNLPIVTRNESDFDVMVVACDSNGIDLRFSNPDNAYKCVVFANYVKISGKKYIVGDDEIHDEVHITQDGRNAIVCIELDENESSVVHISIDGVENYSNMTINVDDNLYNDNENYPMKDMDIVIES